MGSESESCRVGKKSLRQLEHSRLRLPPQSADQAQSWQEKPSPPSKSLKAQSPTPDESRDETRETSPVWHAARLRLRSYAPPSLSTDQDSPVG